MVRHWAPETGKVWFSFGGAWHSAMDRVWTLASMKAPERAIIEDAYDAFVVEWVARGEKHPAKMTMDDLSDLSPRTPQIAREMLHHYYAQIDHGVS
jgi:hypothetical protein